MAIHTITFFCLLFVVLAWAGPSGELKVDQQLFEDQKLLKENPNCFQNGRSICDKEQQHMEPYDNQKKPISDLKRPHYNSACFNDEGEYICGHGEQLYPAGPNNPGCYNDKGEYICYESQHQRV